MKHLRRLASALLLCLTLSACGGSGGGGGNGNPPSNSSCTITSGFCGTLTGLPAGQTVTLYFETSDAGSGNLTLTANGPFTYGLNAAIHLSTTFGVGVVGETPETRCSVTNGGSNAYSGALKLTVVSGVVVTCSAAKAYTVGGTLTGLKSGAQLTLGVDGVYSDLLTLTVDGAFTFPIAVTAGDPYNVTVVSQPPGQNCTANNGAGTIGANVTNVAITCSDVYTVGGTISGLDGPAVMLENNGADDLTLNANGTFTFATRLAAGATYSVTVGTQPSDEQCIVSGGSGTISGNVDNVQVDCGYRKQVLYAFTGSNDGAAPQAGVIMDGAGNLYGTTEVGGGSSHCANLISGGCGVVFKLAPNASGGYTESVLYSFIGYGGDGARPVAGVIMDGAGNLYGTTADGGAGGSGVVFKLAPGGAGSGYTESVLYAFSGGSDGSNPAGALLLDSAGNLYGTTPYGGSSSCTKGCGTVFKLTPNGSGGYTESTLYSFGGGAGGNGPIGGLITDGAGDLYGTTALGGSNGAGAVFELSPNGGGGYTESVLYSFPSIGGEPSADETLIYPAGSLLMDSTGDLYGRNLGTVFKLAPNGSGGYNESDLFRFNFGGPFGGLIMDSTGDLYGALPGGIAGWVFELVPNGSGGYTELNLYTFQGGIYGFTPGPGLVLDASGNLYGTEPEGGNIQDCASNGGCGDVFEISPR